MIMYGQKYSFISLKFIFCSHLYKWHEALEKSWRGRFGITWSLNISNLDRSSIKRAEESSWQIITSLAFQIGRVFRAYSNTLNAIHMTKYNVDIFICTVSLGIFIVN